MGNASSASSDEDDDDYDKTSNPFWIIKHVVKTALKKGKYDENEYMDSLKRLIDLKSAEGILELLKHEKRVAELFDKYMPGSGRDESVLFYAIRTLAQAGEDGKKVIQVLVENGASLKKLCNEMQPVHYASKYANLHIIRYLVDMCGIDTPTAGGLTPFFISTLNVNDAAFDLLLELGANPHVVESNGAMTPLMVSASCSNLHQVDRLLKHPAVNGNFEDKEGRTAIFYSVRAGALAMTKKLVENGCIAENRDFFGINPLELAISHGMNEVAKYLFDCGVEPATLICDAGRYAEMKCTRPIVDGEVPCGRQMAAVNISLDGKRVFVFGGVGTDSSSRAINNPLKYLQDQNLKLKWHLDLHYADLDTVHVDQPFAQEFKSKYASSANANCVWSRCSDRLAISADDKLVCEHVGDFGNGNVMGSLSMYGGRSTFYFEVEILAIQEPGYIFVGMAQAMYDLDTNIGRYERSFALHGNDGRFFYCYDVGDTFGPRFRQGDIIGCGISCDRKEAWFTYNGKFLGVAIQHQWISETNWFPHVGLGSKGDKIRANFGATPFAFDFKAPMLKFVRANIAEGPLLRTVNQAAGTYIGATKEGRELVFAGLEGATKAPLIRLIDINTWGIWDPTSPTSGTNPDFQDADFKKAGFEYDKELNVLYAVAISFSAEDGPWRFSIRRLDCATWTWDSTPLIRIGVDDSVMSLTTRFRASARLCSFWRGYFVAWHPLGSRAVRINLRDLKPSTLWEEVPFEGAPCRRTFYNGTDFGINSEASLVSGGYDSSFYFPNTIHFMEMLEQDGKPRIRWTTPRSTGCCVPRPRFGAGMTCVNSDTMFSFGGINGRNILDSAEIWKVSSKSKDPQSLGALLESGELSDVQILLKDSQSIKCHKIILHARSSGFRAQLAAEPAATSIDLSTHSKEEIMPLIHYLYNDMTDNSSMTLERARPFLKNVVDKFAPEHATRIFECLFCIRLTIESTLGADFASNARNTSLFHDVAFELSDPVKNWKVRLQAHKAVLVARSKFFHALCLGGMKESQEQVIQISDVSPDAFTVILQFLYCGSIDFSACESLIIDVLKAAFLFDIPLLKSDLEDTISQSLTLQNVGSLFLTADLLRASTLRQSCKQFILDNAAKLASVAEFQADKAAIESALSS